MATTEEIVSGIHQAALHGMDLSDGINPTDEDTGLKREEGDKIQDSRVMDGFKIKINANIMTLTYQGESTLKELHSNNYETKMKRRLTQVADFLKSEYKKVTDNSLSLSERGEVEIQAKNSGRFRTWVEAQQEYEIKGIDGIDQSKEEREDIVDDLEVGFT